MKKNKRTITILSVTIGLLILGLTASLSWALTERERADEITTQHMQAGHSTNTATLLESHGITPLDQTAASNNETTAAELTYLIEEEKLAHDVYQAMYDKWGSRVFANITNSEQMHQSMVLAVMQSRGIADPRDTAAGTFTNSDLQALYDKLITQGNQSEQDAFAAAVTIEETDIADIKKTLANLNSKDTDVEQVLDNLLHGSENHLRAFTRQLER